jgi:hypothetical protein
MRQTLLLARIYAAIGQYLPVRSLFLSSFFRNVNSLYGHRAIRRLAAPFA